MNIQCLSFFIKRYFFAMIRCNRYRNNTDVLSGRYYTKYKNTMIAMHSIKLSFNNRARPSDKVTFQNILNNNQRVNETSDSSNEEVLLRSVVFTAPEKGFLKGWRLKRNVT